MKGGSFKSQAKSFYARSGHSLIHLPANLEWITCSSNGDRQVDKILVFRIWNGANQSILLKKERAHKYLLSWFWDKCLNGWEVINLWKISLCISPWRSLPFPPALGSQHLWPARENAESCLAFKGYLRVHNLKSNLRGSSSSSSSSKRALTKLLYITGNSFHKTHNKSFHCQKNWHLIISHKLTLLKMWSLGEGMVTEPVHSLTMRSLMYLFWSAFVCISFRGEPSAGLCFQDIAYRLGSMAKQTWHNLSLLCRDRKSVV